MDRNHASPRDFNTSSYPIIVHCHLCWDWVWQRPQQFVSRLSQRHPILFVETIAPDPDLVTPIARFRTPDNLPNLTLLRLQFPSWRWSDADYVDRTRRELVQEFLRGPGRGRFENAVQWFYDPMAVPAFLGHMDETLTVYDCMDELSQFRGAPPEIRVREAALLAAADVVFTGGRKLWESKKLSNNNCHFYGCGVEVDHFAKARNAETRIPEELAKLPKPVLGYFGVVDERMDYELVAKLADANPNGSVAIVGPVMKVDPNSLPQRPNLHWLGQRQYADLPGFCKGFDACLMPFALNESTEFINPTKALEYMASGRPIISTAVPDVVSNFNSVVKVGRSHDEFVQLCREAAENPDAGAVERGLEMAGRNTWESIVSQLENHIQAALQAKRSSEVSA
ncbi:MAG TPA: glycosyltransferase [Verrucomicrobiae bacterium]|nr:glycosyltransferase [Verrucomicrobiae bacterium]